jgi:hypothetical protein
MEGLLKKLIVNKPANPLDFMIDNLQKPESKY